MFSFVPLSTSETKIPRLSLGVKSRLQKVLEMSFRQRKSLRYLILE